MKINPIKALSAVMACSLVIPVAACSKAGKSGKDSGSGNCRSGKKIEEDTPWFDVNEIKLGNQVDPNREVEGVMQSIAGVDENYIVALSTGYYKLPNENEIPEDLTDYLISKIEVIDRKTKQTVNTFDLKEKLDKNSLVDDAVYKDGIITASVSVLDVATENISKFEKQFDVKTGDVVGSREVTDQNDDLYIDNVYTFKDYTVKAAMDWTSEKSCVDLYVYNNDGACNSVEIKDDALNFYYVPALIQLDANTVLASIKTDKEDKFYRVDLNALSATEEDAASYDWLDLNRISNAFIGSDGYTYYTSEDGIAKIDAGNKSADIVFDFSDCGVSRSQMNSSTIIYCDENSYLLLGRKYSSDAFRGFGEPDYTLYEFTKADKNPHAGKTILELFVGDYYVSDEIAEAIIKFNDNSSDYYVEVSDRYKNTDVDITLNSDDDIEAMKLQRNSKLSNELAMDILNSEGPDILLNTCDMGQLNNPNYLIDLSTYVGDLDPDKYFTNVIEAAKVDGKLYQLPISFCVEGIQTDAKYAGQSGVGFTTEEYEKFISETLNGKDVISLGQAMYFTKLFADMSDKFIVDGKVDFSNADFEKIAEFVKAYAPENSISWDDEDFGAVGAALFKGADDGKVAEYFKCYGMTSYLSNIYRLGNAKSILGVPSTDGRGPAIGPITSIAISAQSVDPEASAEFVKLLMSDETQKCISNNDQFVINRVAFREAGKQACEYLKDKDIADLYSVPEGAKFDEQNVTDMENIILSCSSMTIEDAGISTILIEEMPAFFAGQKDLSEVAAIAQDRAQKVMDERG